MIENIQQTAILIAFICVLVISLFKFEQVNYFVATATIASLFISVAMILVTAFIRIWS